MANILTSSFARRAGAGLFALFAVTGLDGSGQLGAQPNPRGDLSPYSELGPTEDGVIAAWPDAAKELAHAMMSEYGRPDDYTDRSLVWFYNGPWKRTVVHRDSPKRRFFGGDKHFHLEQVVSYRVPKDKLRDLKRFSSELAVDAGSDELSVRSDSQGRNFLTLNLADEIATGARGPDEAWEFLTRVTRLTQAGKSSPYAGGLRFQARDGEMIHQ